MERVTAVDLDALDEARAATVGPYLRLGDGTVWPNPTDPNEVEWQLRYGTPSKADLLVAASMMAAYRELVGQTYKRRNRVASLLRARATVTAALGGES